MLICVYILIRTKVEFSKRRIRFTLLAWPLHLLYWAWLRELPDEEARERMQGIQKWWLVIGSGVSGLFLVVSAETAMRLVGVVLRGQELQAGGRFFLMGVAAAALVLVGAIWSLKAERN